MTEYEWPNDLTVWIDKNLKALGYDMNKPKALSPHILTISDHFKEKTSITDWSSNELKAAYLIYFFPLNYMRAMKVFTEAQKIGLLNDIDEAVDFGCGPGTLTKALLSISPDSIQSAIGVDRDLEVGRYFMDTKRRAMDFSFSPTLPPPKSSNSLLTTAYTLNEMYEAPAGIWDYDNLIIIEPSTKQNWPSFLKLRDQLIEKKYNILAPCPHQNTCPLSQSKKDWCHDRVYWSQPPWFEELEKHLPIKNKSMTFSYLIASRNIKNESTTPRLVGDAQVEKGKTRWMICRNEEREFISFLKRYGKPPKLYRGDKIKLMDVEKKGNELRITPESFLKE